MEESISRAAGAGVFLSVCGRQLEVKGRTLGNFALVEAEILRIRGNPFAMVTSAVDEFAAKNGQQIPDYREFAKQALETCVRQVVDNLRTWRFVTSRDYMDFSDTPRGRAYMLWLCIRHNTNAPTPDEVLEFVLSRYQTRDANWVSEAEVAVAQASGDDQLGNSTGQPSPEKASS